MFVYSIVFVHVYVTSQLEIAEYNQHNFVSQVCTKFDSQAEIKTRRHNIIKKTCTYGTKCINESLPIRT